MDNGDNSDAEYLLPALVLNSDELFDPFEAPFEVIGSEVGSSPHGKALDGLRSDISDPSSSRMRSPSHSTWK